LLIDGLGREDVEDRVLDGQRPGVRRLVLAHKDKIDIISPTWYQIDETGWSPASRNPSC
jgi:hypothetical protein